MHNILVTGSNGLLGQALVQKLRERKDIFLTAASRHESLITADGFHFEQMNICDPASIHKVFEKHRPKTVIHTAALTEVDECEKNQSECLQVNVTGTENILKACEKAKAHLIHLSTDFIFSGNAGPYREEDAPAPVNFYGRSKLFSEEKVRTSTVPWTILRTILVYGTARPNFVHWIARSLKTEKPIQAVTDQVRMPTWNEDLAEACIQAAVLQRTGVFHVSGRDSVSIFEFAKTAAECFGLNSRLISPVLSRDLNQPARRPLKTGFILDKAVKELNYKPYSLGVVLQRIQQNVLSGLP